MPQDPNNPVLLLNTTPAQLAFAQNLLRAENVPFELLDSDQLTVQLKQFLLHRRERIEQVQRLNSGQHHLLELVARSAPLAETLNFLLLLIESQTQGLLCSCLLLENNRISQGFGPSLPADYINAFDQLAIGPKVGSCGTAMYRKQPVIVRDLMQDPLWEDYRHVPAQFGLRACWSTPILRDDETVLGAFAMYYCEPREPSASELHLTRVATHLAGIAIMHEQHEQQLQQLNAELESRITERTAALSASNAELEAFAYSVSHDLRAPLHRINGFSEILEDECGTQLSEAGREYLAQISKGVDQMRGLIDELLRLSQLSQHSLQRQPVNLSEMVNQICADLQTHYPQRKVDFVIAQELLVLADPALLRIAISHLLDNAWKFTRRTNAARVEFGGNGNGLFFVRDNGAGFDRAKAKRLFSPFQRYHLHSQYEGSGTGLAIAHRIVRLHGGQIECHSEPDQGAQFFFSLNANA